ncbi:LOW QUALITY PROTEIN: hypothetical protein PHMEG_00017599 [Phytophthora megakarya]|uniref:Uncharacterized protein n=1 Tax=Phytophthora megakarya TaxID=4795 RepID=A0A225VW73_9STRA|nr:LOW QUALITY PROTEIN: hypothetical protein PHMEG_00017599 [Phytophthora megakarya]
MVLPTVTLALHVQRVVDTVTTMPWSILKQVEQTLLWSVPPEPTGPRWADNVFIASKKISISCIEDELTDSCNSGMFSSDEDVDWSSDEVSLDGYSDDDDDSSMFSMLSLPPYEAERWYWTPPSSMNSTKLQKYETASQRSADLDEFGPEHGDERYRRRPTMYAMPSIDFSADGVVDLWVDRYGANKADFTYLAESTSDTKSQSRRRL